MYYILYNPKSNSGKTKKSVLKLQKKLSKRNIDSYLVNLFELDKVLDIKSKLVDSDIIVIAGGDGTLHRLVNNQLFSSLKNRIFMYRSGRGNDFSRGHKGDFFEITDEIKNLPYLVNNEKKSKFLNGIGVGIDALTCQKQMENFYSGVKESYFNIAFKAFKTFKTFSIDVNIDGVDYHYDNVWFFVVQNGKYFGGGMKVSPESKREDDTLELCVIHDISFKKLLTIFPIIFIGKHTIFKKCVTVLKGQNFKFHLNGFNLLQRDGEVEYVANDIEVKRYI